MKNPNKIILALFSISFTISFMVGLVTMPSTQSSTATAAKVATTKVTQTSKLDKKNSIKLSGSTNSYQYITQNFGEVTLDYGENTKLWLRLRNNGTTNWEKGTFRLGTSNSRDRNSVFSDNSWIVPSRIAMIQDIVAPGELADFYFTIHAPDQSGVYYEYFRPVIDGEAWLTDVGIYWKVIVKKPNEDVSVLPIYNKIRTKKIVVSLSQQNMKCYEGDDIVCDFIISSGASGTPTPTGNFKVERKRDVAYSAAYGLYMNYWMAFTPNEAYGIHELPYWKYSWGIVTEGQNHLGVKVSHGCVRLGIGSARQVYDWAPVGTPVEIVN